MSSDGTGKGEAFGPQQDLYIREGKVSCDTRNLVGGQRRMQRLRIPTTL